LIRPDALALVGPTASGKTGLSLDLAEAMDGEIISMDSRQVYRGMDVGTAKVGREERRRVPHHGLDLVEPRETYSAGRFGRDARRWIDEIRGRGRVPLLVGGTGFFLRAVTEPLFREPPLDPSRRASLRGYLERLDGDEMERWIRVLDPERLDTATEGGPQRMARTLEVALLTGRPLSWWHREAPADAPPVPVLVVVLDLDREELDRRIDARTEAMLAHGLVEEVTDLLDRGVDRASPGLTAVGYREIVGFLDGRWSLDEAAASIARATRQYARRQLTWFRNQLPSEGVLRLDASLPVGELVRTVDGAWKQAMEPGCSAGKGPL
jgi:tRNA dimethylallyltransferase